MSAATISRIRAAGIAVLLLAGAASWLPADARTGQARTIITGRVVGIADGDTLTLLDATLRQHKIRLEGIDAPEKAQPFGSRAKLALSALAYGREASAACQRPDRYGRQVCKVLVGGRDVNAAMIAAGMAWHYTAYAKTQRAEDASAYARAQDRAQRQRVGLWADAAPVAPWEWRRANKQAR